MNWQSATIEDLKKYSDMKESLVNISDRISALKFKYVSIKSSSIDAMNIRTNKSNKVEDRLLDNIVERQKLGYTYKATKKLVEVLERSLKELDDTEQLVLNRFYICRSKGHVEKLMEELNYEQRRIYQIKDEALYKLTIKMYGIVDY